MSFHSSKQNRKKFFDFHFLIPELIIMKIWQNQCSGMCFLNTNLMTLCCKYSVNIDSNLDILLGQPSNSAHINLAQKYRFPSLFAETGGLRPQNIRRRAKPRITREDCVNIICCFLKQF